MEIFKYITFILNYIDIWDIGKVIFKGNKPLTPVKSIRWDGAIYITMDELY